MQKNLLSKILAIVNVVLFVGVSIQSAFANEVSISATSVSEDDFIDIMDKNNNKGYFGLGFILCIVHIMDWSNLEYWLARNVKFELIDYDTGELIQEKTCLIGIHLFIFLPRGHNYMINATTSKGWNTAEIRNLGFFDLELIDIWYY